MKDEKILQFEMMSEEELENVAGGTCAETANDSRFLNVLLQGTGYHRCDRYGEFKIFFSYPAQTDVKDSWRSLGIKFSFDAFSGNKYFDDGKEISQKEAWAYAEKTVGKHLTEEQWNW